MRFSFISKKNKKKLGIILLKNIINIHLIYLKEIVAVINTLSYHKAEEDGDSSKYRWKS